MPDYSINIPVNLYGQEKIRQLTEAIKQTSQQTMIGGAEFRTWATAVEFAANSGFTFNTSLNRVQRALKDNVSGVEAFTDRLKLNIKEQERVAKIVDQGRDAQERATRSVVEGARKEAFERAKVTAAINAQTLAGIKLMEANAAKLMRSGSVSDINMALSMGRESVLNPVTSIDAMARAKMQNTVTGEYAIGAAIAQREEIERQAEAKIRDAAARAAAKEEAIAARAVANRESSILRERLRSEGSVARAGSYIMGSEIGSSVGIPGLGFISMQAASGLGATGSTAMGIGAAAIGTLATYEITSKVMETAKWAQEQRNLSKELGISAGQMATFSLIANQTGTNVAPAIKSIQNLATELERLERGGPRSREISTALHELGLTDATAFKPASEGLKDIMSALTKIPDEAEASRRAVDLIGDSGRQLVAMIKDMPELQDKLKLDDSTVERIARFRDVISDMESSMKLGLLDAVSYSLSGILPDRSTPKPIVPRMSPIRIPEGGTFSIGGFDPGSWAASGSNPSEWGAGISMTSPAELRARNLNLSRQYAMETGTPDDVHRAESEDILREREKLRKSFVQGLTITPDIFTSGMTDLSKRQHLADEKRRLANEYTHQQQAFEELEPIEGMDLDRISAERHRLPKQFNRLTGTAAYQERFGVVQGALNTLGEAANQDSQLRANEKLFTHILTEFHKEETAEDKRNREKVKDIETGVRAANIQLHGDLALGEAKAGLSASTRQGATTFARMLMTPNQISTLDYQLQMAAIQGTAIPHGTVLGQQIGTYQNALTDLQRVPGEESQRQQEIIKADLDKAQLDLKALEISTTQKSVEAINKFNESIVKAAEAMRSEFASGFTGVIMGAQHGGKGALGALRGFGEKIEGTLLHNVGERIWDSGASGVARQIGSSLPDWLTKGTIFGKLNDKIDPGLTDNTNATKDNTDSIRQLTGALGGGAGAGSSPSGGAGGGTVTPGAAGGSDGGTTAGGVAAEVHDMASVAASLGAVTGGSTGQKLTAMASVLGKLGGVMKGVQYAGNIPKILSGSLNTKEEIGAIAGTAALGIGAFQGVRTIARGGVGNAFSGTAMTLASIAPFFGPVAGPIIGAAAAVTGLVGSFIPDPHTVRAQQMERRAFTQQYMAPQAMNLSMSGTGAYSDVDFMGNVRSSHFSPYPIASNSYLDVPRRTVVPGHTLSGFGGYQNVTGAKTPTIVNYHNWNVSTMDAKSFIDNGHKILDAVNHSLSTSYHPIIRTLHGALGHH